MWRSKKIVNCLNCNKEFATYPGSGGKFCCCSCSGESREKNGIKVRLEKFNKGLLSDRNRQAIKKVLIESLGFQSKCSICGITEWLGKKIPFLLDHIDGNAFNNKVDNLRFLCSNCDSQSDTYKKRNKLGRKKRLALNK